jgi:hypothetical protein
MRETIGLIVASWGWLAAAELDGRTLVPLGGVLLVVGWVVKLLVSLIWQVRGTLDAINERLAKDDVTLRKLQTTIENLPCERGEDCPPQKAAELGNRQK